MCRDIVTACSAVATTRRGIAATWPDIVTTRSEIVTACKGHVTTRMGIVTTSGGIVTMRMPARRQTRTRPPRGRPRRAYADRKGQLRNQDGSPGAWMCTLEHLFRQV